MNRSSRFSTAHSLVCLLWLLLTACQPAGEAEQSAAETAITESDQAQAGKAVGFPEQAMELVLTLEGSAADTDLSIAYQDGLVPAVGDDAILETRAGQDWTPAGRARVTEVSTEQIRLNPYEGGLAGPGRARIQVARPMHRCDLAAASPLDERAVAAPVDFEQLPVEAVEYCSQAVSQYPGTVRFHFQMARALDAHQQQASAVRRYRECLMLAPDYSAALLALAGKHQTGEGVAKDAAIAEQFLEQAHALGNVRASYLLAQLWLASAAQDPGKRARALELEHAAAEAGDAQAQARLASRYETGELVGQDSGQALFWHEKAANQGLAASQMALAAAFASGKGRPQDWRQAREWWQQAANHDHAAAQLALADSLEQGQGLSAPDYEQALYWYRRAAEGGNALGQYHLGRMLAQGRGTAVNSEESEKWLRLALAAGIGEARRWLPRTAPQERDSDGEPAQTLASGGRHLRQMRLFRVKTSGYMDSYCRSELREEMQDLGLRETDAAQASARLLIHMSKPVYYQSRFGPFTSSGYRIQFQAEVLRRGDNVRLFYTRGVEDGDDKTEACVDALDEIFDDLDDARD